GSNPVGGTHILRTVVSCVPPATSLTRPAPLSSSPKHPLLLCGQLQRTPTRASSHSLTRTYRDWLTAQGAHTPSAAPLPHCPRCLAHNRPGSREHRTPSADHTTFSPRRTKLPVSADLLNENSGTSQQNRRSTSLVPAHAGVIRTRVASL